MIFGYDGASYQGNFNHAQAKAEGFGFALWKCTQGSGYRNPNYPWNRDAAHAAGLVFAAYHYVSTDDPNAQADNLAGWIGDRSIPVMIDQETGSGNEAQNLAVADAIRARGMRVILNYFPRWYWSQVGSPPVRTGPLMASHYASGSGYASTLDQQVQPSWWTGYGGQPVAVLQFTDSALIAGQTLDSSAYPGTLDQLKTLFYGNGGFLMALTDDEQRLMFNQTRELHQQLISQTAADTVGDWSGWPTADGSGRSLTGLDFLRESHRELNQRLDLGGRPGGDKDTLLGHVLSTRAELRAALATIAGMQTAVTALAKNPAITPEQIKADIDQAVAQHIQITGTVQITPAPAGGTP